MQRKRKPSEEVGLQRRVKRMERVYLILCVAVLLLAIFGVWLAVTAGRIVGTFEFLTEQLDLISQQVDAVRQGIQGA